MKVSQLREIFPPKRYLAMSRDVWGCHKLGSMVPPAPKWVDNRDASKLLCIGQPAPTTHACSHAHIHKNVSIAEGEKPWAKPTGIHLSASSYILMSPTALFCKVSLLCGISLWCHLIHQTDKLGHTPTWHSQFELVEWNLIARYFSRFPQWRFLTNLWGKQNQHFFVAHSFEKWPGYFCFKLWVKFRSAPCIALWSPGWRNPKNWPYSFHGGSSLRGEHKPWCLLRLRTVTSAHIPLAELIPTG